ncbi:MAG: LamG-like jellyroll fold domain-containing protein, partial [bacterium]
YTLFLKDGLLGLLLATDREQRVFMAQVGPVADGQWHHVAAVVNRHRAEAQDDGEEEGDASALFVDGEVVLQFDATALADDATSHSRLRIGRSRAFSDDASPAFFEGELDEIDLFRSALSPDLVASIYIAGSAGKFGSLGNLPTSAGRPPCLVALGEITAAVPEAAALSPLYDEVIEALRQGKEGLARRRLRELRDQALEMAPEPMFPNPGLHVIHGQADACLQQRDLQAAAGMSSDPAASSAGGEALPLE